MSDFLSNETSFSVSCVKKEKLRCPIRGFIRFQYAEYEKTGLTPRGLWGILSSFNLLNSTHPQGILSDLLKFFDLLNINKHTFSFSIFNTGYFLTLQINGKKCPHISLPGDFPRSVQLFTPVPLFW
ncbi:MAG: hypothetical protein B6245_08505 [Desulfobacteraceae bacterium 4572_88]|nr:MAG: hypothetical protein B6245_08505 [Desulfobacteraceae bacterium 4572_88]